MESDHQFPRPSLVDVHAVRKSLDQISGHLLRQLQQSVRAPCHLLPAMPSKCSCVPAEPASVTVAPCACGEECSVTQHCRCCAVTITSITVQCNEVPQSCCQMDDLCKNTPPACSIDQVEMENSKTSCSGINRNHCEDTKTASPCGKAGGCGQNVPSCVSACSQVSTERQQCPSAASFACSNNNGVLPERKAALLAAVIVSILSILGCIGEAVASFFYGSEGGASISLLGFGADSAVEIISASLVCWRFYAELRGESHRSPSAVVKERLVSFIIALMLALLALGVIATSIASLVLRYRSELSVSSVIISTLSAAFFISLYTAKLAVNLIVKSKALASDAGCSRSCVALSLVLVVGSSIGSSFPSAYYIDPITAMAISCLILYEGVEGMKASVRPDFDGGCGCDDDVGGGTIGKCIRPVLLCCIPTTWRAQV